MLDPGLGGLHFVRPLWLLALLPAGYLYWRARRQARVDVVWRGAIAPHLLDHLMIRARRSAALGPAGSLLATLVVASLAMAGPAWHREGSPFVHEHGPLVIALSLDDSMNAGDVQPSRLERAKQKIRDLLALRSGTRNALVVYAHEARLVVPPTDDASIIELYVGALETDMLAPAGSDPGAVIDLAGPLLDRERTPGAILFVTDTLPGPSFERLAAESTSGGHRILALVVAADDGGVAASGATAPATVDPESLDAFVSVTGGDATGVAVDDRDVRWLARRLDAHRLAVVGREEAPLRDAGVWLVAPLVVLMLPWFRLGWTIRWVAVAVVLAALTLASGVSATDGVGRARDLAGEVWLRRLEIDPRDYLRAKLAYRPGVSSPRGIGQGAP